MATVVFEGWIISSARPIGGSFIATTVLASGSLLHECNREQRAAI